MKVLNFYHLGKVIPETAKYIGRPMPHMGLSGSKFANPFKVTEQEPNEIVVAKYKKWLWEQIRSGNITLEDLLTLEGYDLVCFCKPKPCHGDVLIAAVKWARAEYNKRHGFVDGYWEW